MELVRPTFPRVLTEITTTVVGVSLGTSIWVWFTQSTFGSGSDLRIRLIQVCLGFVSRGFKFWFGSRSNRFHLGLTGSRSGSAHSSGQQPTFGQTLVNRSVQVHGSGQRGQQMVNAVKDQLTEDR